MNPITANEFVVLWQYSRDMDGDLTDEREHFRRTMWTALEPDSRIVLREFVEAFQRGELGVSP